MKKRIFFAALTASSLIVSAAQAQDPIPLGSAGGVSMFAVPQDSPGDGFNSAKIVLKTDDASAKMVTFENIAINNAVQSWGSLGGANAQTPEAGATYDASWAAFDSHLLITPDMIAGGVFMLTETNDGSLGEQGLPQLLGGAAIANVGIGPTKTVLETDAFFLDSAFQSNELDFAQVVSQTDATPTVTVGVLGEGIINSGEPGGAFFDAVAVAAANPESFCTTTDAQFCFDFATNPVDRGAILGGDGEWRGTGGVEDGYLKVTDAANGQRGVVVVPVDDANSIVAGGRTGGANAAHHIDNLTATIADGQVSISAALRVGGGTDRPADGFSFSFVPNSDPAAVGDTNGWAGIGGEPENLPEEGTISGISIGFDEWQSGPAPSTEGPSEEWGGPNAVDVVGMSLRVDGEIVGQARLDVLNGELGDVNSLQTGPNTGGLEALGWATLTIDAPTEGANLGNVTVQWKGQKVDFVGVPEPASASLLLMSLLGLAGLRRKK